MIKRWRLAALTAATSIASFATPALAQCTDQTPLGEIKNIPCVEADGATLDRVLSTVFLVAGSLSLLFLVIGGFRYVLSAGDPENTKKAKNTVLYAVVGLGIALSGFVIVNYVLGEVT